VASLIAFFTNLWGGNTATANPSASEKLGFQYFYDEDGSLMYELGCGGANSTGAARYVYLPTTGKKRCVDPAGNGYVYTSFSKQQTVFNGEFLESTFYENSGPAFTFAHEFRQLMDTNNAIGGVVDILGTELSKVDAENFTKKFTSSLCTCGLQ
jgi:hypothetical protein